MVIEWSKLWLDIGHGQPQFQFYNFSLKFIQMTEWDDLDSSCASFLVLPDPWAISSIIILWH